MAGYVPARWRPKKSQTRGHAASAASTRYIGRGRAEERVAGVVVAVELELLARGLQRLLLLRDLLGRRVLVLLAEQPEQRAPHVGGHVDRRDGHAIAEAFGRHDDTAAVAVDRGVDVDLARDEPRVATAGAVADHADLAVAVGQRAQHGDRGRDVADDARVGCAAGLARGLGRVVGARAGRVAVVEVRAQRAVALTRRTCGSPPSTTRPSPACGGSRRRRGTDRRRAGGRSTRG